MDKVTFPGSRHSPTCLYTCDVDPSYLSLEEPKIPQTRAQARKERVSARLIRDKYKEQIFSGEINVSGLFETSEDLVKMRIYSF